MTFEGARARRFTGRVPSSYGEPPVARRFVERRLRLAKGTRRQSAGIPRRITDWRRLGAPALSCCPPFQQLHRARSTGRLQEV